LQSKEQTAEHPQDHENMLTVTISRIAPVGQPLVPP
jgi:hypothetical protein